MAAKGAAAAWRGVALGVAIEERSFVAKSAPLDDGQGRMGDEERSAAEPGDEGHSPA
jgi:hypothetical protein